MLVVRCCHLKNALAGEDQMNYSDSYHEVEMANDKSERLRMLDERMLIRQ